MPTEKREVIYDRYRSQRVVVKWAVKVAKRTTDWRRGMISRVTKDVLERGKVSRQVMRWLRI